MARAKRSNFERKVAKSLTDRGVKYRYEPAKFTYYLKPYQAECSICGSDDVWSKRVYTPDFYLVEFDVYVETKGRLTNDNRTLMKAVKRDNPEIDLRIVFMANNKISKTSKTRCLDWAEQHGFIAAVGDIPNEWLNNR